MNRKRITRPPPSVIHHHHHHHRHRRLRQQQSFPAIPAVGSWRPFSFPNSGFCLPLQLPPTPPPPPPNRMPKWPVPSPPPSTPAQQSPPHRRTVVSSPTRNPPPTGCCCWTTNWSNSSRRPSMPSTCIASAWAARCSAPTSRRPSIRGRATSSAPVRWSAVTATSAFTIMAICAKCARNGVCIRPTLSSARTTKWWVRAPSSFAVFFFYKWNNVGFVWMMICCLWFYMNEAKKAEQIFAQTYYPLKHTICSQANICRIFILSYFWVRNRNCPREKKKRKKKKYFLSKMLVLEWGFGRMFVRPYLRYSYLSSENICWSLFYFVWANIWILLIDISNWISYLPYWCCVKMNVE